MKILCVGDIFGKPGRQIVKRLLPRLVERHSIDFVIANAENAAGGRGLTPKVADELMALPINVFTAGNHIWQNQAIHEYLEKHSTILRPQNCPPGRPGKGVWSGDVKGVDVAVVNLQGRVYMHEEKESLNPFTIIDDVLRNLSGGAGIIVVDFHAEATSEKKALAFYLDGRVSAVVGTHTHIQTADEQILPRGTAYISDMGMTGPHYSVIGLDKDVALHRFLTGNTKEFKVAEEDVRLEGVVLDIDERNGRAINILRIQQYPDETDGDTYEHR